MSEQRFDLRSFLARHGVQDHELFGVIAKFPLLDLETGPWIAGGAVRNAILNKPLETDIDVFFSSQEQLDEFENGLTITFGAKKVREHANAITYEVEWEINKKVKKYLVQVIRIQWYQTPEEVIDSFDFTICQFLTDGKTLLTGDYSLWDLARRRLALNRLTYAVSTVRRMLKYGKQGFTACSGVIADILTQAADRPATIDTTVISVD